MVGLFRKREKVGKRDREGAMCPLLIQPCGTRSSQRQPTELPTTLGCSSECLDKGREQEKLMRGRVRADPQGALGGPACQAQGTRAPTTGHTRPAGPMLRWREDYRPSALRGAAG
ncbi:hypothetical protein AOLI_G00022020 [Acnodon oligacanthus]